MRLYPLSILALIFVATVPVSYARPPQEKPNFVIILLDDAGYANFSHLGHPTVETPNISELARDGMNFTNYYSASPACTASRYGLLTGRNPARSGMRWVIAPNNPRYLHTKEITIADILKERGYATGIFGKWHLGTPNAENDFTTDAFPLAHGFDTWLGTNVSHDYLDGKLIQSDPSGKDPAPGFTTLATDLGQDHEWTVLRTLTQHYEDAAVEFIREYKEGPFFAYIPLNFPHLQLAASDGSLHTSAAGLLGDTMNDIDKLVGVIRRTLEKERIAENTMIVFTSDNGPWIRFQDTEDHPRYAEARILIGSARPFRDGKGSTWEGGQREPGVFCWPGMIAPQSVCRQAISAFDLLPTITALAGGALPTDRTLDGRDIRAYLFPEQKVIGPVEEVPEFNFIYTGVPRNSICAIRQGSWKLHIALYSQTGNNYGYAPDTPKRTDLEKPLLFDLNQDPSERHDLASEHPDRVALLQSSLAAFRQSLDQEPPFWGREPEEAQKK